MKSILLILLNLPFFVGYGQQQITDLRSSDIELSSGPSNFLRYQDQLLFVAEKDGLGRELWTSDGTTEGTKLVKDINIGKTSAYFSNLLEFKGMVYFIADDGVNGYQLWVTDGTAPGTKPISTNIYKVVDKLVTDGNYIYFLQKSDYYTLELWKSDGTTAGTTIIKGDIPIWNTPGNLTTAGGLLFFSFQPIGTNDSRVWRSDGTSEGTFPVTTELDGSGSDIGGTSQPTQFIEFNGNLYFIARGVTPYPETVGLMRSDGTIAGTYPVKGLHPGSRLINHGQVLVYNNKMYFSFFETDFNRFFIWESDGTEFNTKLIYDQSFQNYFSPSSILAKDGYFYFTTGNATFGTSLIKFNVQSHAVEMLKEISGQKNEPFIFNTAWSANSIIESKSGSFYIKSKFDDWSLPELWTSDGTSAGTIKLSNIKGVGDLAWFKDKVYFNGSSDGSYELWTSTGTLSSTNIFKDINPGFYGLGYATLVTNADKAMFIGNDGVHGSEPWATDGTSQGTAMVKDLNPGSLGSFPYNLIEWNDQFVFTASASNKRLLFKSDGTSEGTEAFPNIPLNQSISQWTKSSDGKTLFFATNNSDETQSLYHMNETQIPFELKNFGKNLYGVGFWVREMAVAGTTLYMLIEAEGVDLWKSDGTKEGTIKVADLHEASELVAVNNTVYFTVIDNYYDNEKEVYKSDGTAQGTTMLRDLNGSASSEPSGLKAFGNKLIFTATDESYGREMWVSDGTFDGTKMLKDIFTGQQHGIFGTQFAILDEQFYFTANDGSHGAELWKSDGTTENTKLVKDMLPGAEGSTPVGLKSIDGKLYFSAYTPAYGHELWSSDGTGENTNLLADLIPGPEYSNPDNFAKLNNLIVFSAKTVSNGVQLWNYGINVTGVDEVSTSLSVFPNPSNGVFKINFNKKINNGFIEIFTSNGRSIQKIDYSGDETSVDLAHSPPGVYVIKVFDKSRCYTSKVIKF